MQTFIYEVSRVKIIGNFTIIKSKESKIPKGRRKKPTRFAAPGLPPSRQMKMLLGSFPADSPGLTALLEHIYFYAGVCGQENRHTHTPSPLWT